MKINEPFNPNIKSTPAPEGLIFRLAESKDSDALTKLMSARSPMDDDVVLKRKTDREIELNTADPYYRLFVGELNGVVVGLCRYYHSQGLSKEKNLYPAPEGWYCMGMLVDKKFRRQGIARFLFQHRLEAMKNHGARVIYSGVDTDNLASLKMHHEFGFQELGKITGFLSVKFEDEGILFQKKT